MKRSLANRLIDFTGRAAFGGENGFVRDKRLGFSAIVLALLVAISGSWLFGFPLVLLMVAVCVSDFLRYNEEHGHG